MGAGGLPRKPYVAIDNKWMFRDARLVEGAYWSAGANAGKGGWVDAPLGGIEVPADTLIRSQSVFEIAAPRYRERVWFNGNTVAPADGPKLHFELSDVFEPAIEATLNLYNVFTLEDVADELDALVPGSEFEGPEKKQRTMPLRDLLAKESGGDLKQVDAWIQAAKDIVRPAPAPASAPPTPLAPLTRAPGPAPIPPAPPGPAAAPRPAAAPPTPTKKPTAIEIQPPALPPESEAPRRKSDTEV